MAVSADVSVVSAIAGSARRSPMKRPTSSAAMCCASAALPPLPKSRSFRSAVERVGDEVDRARERVGLLGERRPRFTRMLSSTELADRRCRVAHPASGGFGRMWST